MNDDEVEGSRVNKIIFDTGRAFTLLQTPLSPEYLAANAITADELKQATAVMGAVLSGFVNLPLELQLAVMAQDNLIDEQTRLQILHTSIIRYMSISQSDEFLTKTGVIAQHQEKEGTK